VLRETLSLLEYPAGPVLIDYPVDAVEDADTATAPACPVNFQIRGKPGSAVEMILAGLEQEIAAMQTWHDQAPAQSTRATPLISGLSVTEIRKLFADFVSGSSDTKQIGDRQLADLLRRASEDLKAFYFTAVAAQPGQSTDAGILADWFWGETHAAACINEVRKACLRQEAADMQLTGKLLLIPRSQLHRFEE
jgi:hypothetical protein